MGAYVFARHTLVPFYGRVVAPCASLYSAVLAELAFEPGRTMGVRHSSHDAAAAECPYEPRFTWMVLSHWPGESLAEFLQVFMFDLCASQLPYGLSDTPDDSLSLPPTELSLRTAPGF